MNESHACSGGDGRGRGAGGGGSPEGDRSVRPRRPRHARPTPILKCRRRPSAGGSPRSIGSASSKQADACKKPGELGALLRREGLYCSHADELAAAARAGRARAGCARAGAGRSRGRSIRA